MKRTTRKIGKRPWTTRSPMQDSLPKLSPSLADVHLFQLYCFLRVPLLVFFCFLDPNWQLNPSTQNTIRYSVGLHLTTSETLVAMHFCVDWLVSTTCG
ncbi:hypothetical protein Mapa_005991 [Marchantia paleacea]|nr:hypothetical protein Mapa_005991 [Marchantia paleacea]